MIARRRIAGLLAGMAVWPVIARADLSSLPVVGLLGSGSPEGSIDSLAGLRQGLREAGYVEGQNLILQSRWADGQYERLPALAAELIARRVSVIVGAALPATMAAKQATSTIPIVFVIGADPIKQGIVPSLARPGANITGVAQLYGEVGGKRLQLLHELVPAATKIAVVSNPANPNAQSHLDEVRKAAVALGKRIDVVRVSTEPEIVAAFGGLPQSGVEAVLLVDDPLFRARREQIVALARRHAIPTVHFGRDFAVAGGLISYGSNNREDMRLAGGYVGRILKGAKPSDLPVLQPTVFELVINLTAAKALGLVIPMALLARADEVIE